MRLDTRLLERGWIYSLQNKVPEFPEVATTPC